MKTLLPQAMLLAAGVGVVACGCATTPSTQELLPTKRPTLFRTQAGDQVSLQWESTARKRYAVFYSPDRDDPNQWRLLPGYEQIEGRGGTEVTTFSAPQPGRLHYRVLPVEARSE